MKKKEAQLEFEKKFRDACRVVESMTRSIGPDCQIIFTDGDVQVAPLSWSGCVNESSLYRALRTAINESRDPSCYNAPNLLED